MKGTLRVSDAVSHAWTLTSLLFALSKGNTGNPSLWWLLSPAINDRTNRSRPNVSTQPQWIGDAYPCPIFSKRVYFFLGSPTLTIVPEWKKDRDRRGHMGDQNEQNELEKWTRPNNRMYTLFLMFHRIWIDRRVRNLLIHPNSTLFSAHWSQCSMLTRREKLRGRGGTRD